MRKVLPDPIPWEYGYPVKETGSTWYGRYPQEDPATADPQFHTHGEDGLYTDTQLGRLGKPNVFQRIANGLKPRRQFFGLGDATTPATTDDVIAIMNAHNDRVFALTVVSSTAVAVSAFLTLFRTLKLIKNDK